MQYLISSIHVLFRIQLNSFHGSLYKILFWYHGIYDIIVADTKTLLDNICSLFLLQSGHLLFLGLSIANLVSSNISAQYPPLHNYIILCLFLPMIFSPKTRVWWQFFYSNWILGDSFIIYSGATDLIEDKKKSEEKRKQTCSIVHLSVLIYKNCIVSPCSLLRLV